MELKILQEGVNGIGILIEKSYQVTGAYLHKRLKEDVPLTADNKISSYIITGIFAQGDVQNRNGRVYPFSDILKPECDMYINEVINRNRASMELGHPDNLDINTDRICSKIRKFWYEGANVYGEAVVGSRGVGGLVRDYIDMGLEFGVSTRGSGSVENSVVQKDFKLYYVDVVLNPSAPDAYMNHQFEQRANKMFDAGVTEKELNIIKKNTKNLPKDPEKIVKILENFVNKLARSYK